METEDLADIAHAALRREMARTNVAAKTLSKAAGAGETAVRDFLERKNITLKQLLRFANALKVPVHRLLMTEDEARLGVPKEPTVEALLEAAMLVDEEDRERRSAVQLLSKALHIALVKLAENPTNENDPGYVRSVCDDVRKVAAAVPLVPSQQTSSTIKRKANSSANNRPS